MRMTDMSDGLICFSDSSKRFLLCESEIIRAAPRNVGFFAEYGRMNDLVRSMLLAM